LAAEKWQELGSDGTISGLWGFFAAAPPNRLNSFVIPCRIRAGKGTSVAEWP
jgi:hypothetical protein